MRFINPPDKYPCPLCDKAFRQKESLRRHLIKEHHGEKISGELFQSLWKKKGDYIIGKRK